MTGQPSLRLSIQIPSAPDLASWTEKARRADECGFYSISVPDHLGPSLPQFAPLVALSAAAAVTSRLRLATTVLDNDFRHPVMLAKEIATLDVLSNGRVDMGMGAGWLEEDYTKTGITTWDPPATRVNRLFESIELLKQLFTGEPVTFTGEYYTVTDFQSFPKPIQSPVPLMIGARGKRMLTMAPREAQIVSVLAAPGDGGSRLGGFEEQLSWIADARSDDRDDVMIGLRIPFGEVAGPGETRRTVAQRLGARMGLDADAVLESPFFLVGHLDDIAEHLMEIRARYGISYITLSEEMAWQVAPILEQIGS